MQCYILTNFARKIWRNNSKRKNGVSDSCEVAGYKTYIPEKMSDYSVYSTKNRPQRNKVFEAYLSNAIVANCWICSGFPIAAVNQKLRIWF